MDEFVTDKFYVPTAEEFHIGFRYYERQNDKIVGEFELRTFDNILSTEEDLSQGLVLVKYLDREDIESFGFDLDQIAKDGAYFYKGTLMDENQWALCCTKAMFHDYTYLYIHDFNKKSDSSFEGICRNKSELKRILKQLNITL